MKAAKAYQTIRGWLMEESTTSSQGGIQLRVWAAQGIKFLSVGVLNTLVDGGLYFVLTRWLGLASLPILAKGISYTAGVLNSFYWNKTWTFRSTISASKTFLPFLGANLAALGLNAGVMYLAYNRAGLPESISFFLATASTLLWNFALSKFLIFKK